MIGILSPTTHRWIFAAGMLPIVACGGPGGNQAPDVDLACIAVAGQGETIGDRHRLKGSGVFTFDGVERPAQVGLYLFDMIPTSDDGFNVDAQYQFNWGGGDSFLTRDIVHFNQTLEPRTYRFNVPMTIFDASGIFAHLVDKRPIALAAEIRFGPPRNPGDADSAVEFFEVSGDICN